MPPKKAVTDLRAWLEKQGYPLEMMVAQAFANADAIVNQSAYYVDNETQKPREIDVVASWNFSATAGSYRSSGGLTLFVECKSQQTAPWVIFSGDPHRRRLSSSRFLLTRDAKPIFYKLDWALGMLSMLNTSGYGITQAFTSRLDVPYQAIMSTVKAAQAEIDNTNRAYQNDDVSGHSFHFDPHIAIPVVVTDASIYDCHLDESNQPTLREIPYGVVEWKYPFTPEASWIATAAYVYNASWLGTLINHAAELRDYLVASLPIWLEEASKFNEDKTT